MQIAEQVSDRPRSTVAAAGGAELWKFWPCVSQPPIRQRDAADARFDQPARGQELLDALVAVRGVAAVRGCRSRALRTPPELTMSKARAVNVSRPADVGVDFAAHAVEAFEHGAAVGHAFWH